MAKVNLPKLRSFNRGSLKLQHGMNEGIPAYLVADLLTDDRFEITLEEGESFGQAVLEAEAAETELDANGVPKDKNYRLRVIAGAIDALDLTDEKAWTAAGKPDANRLTQMLGWQVTAVDRDTAFDRLTKGTLEAVAFVPRETPAEEPQTSEETAPQTDKDGRGEGSKEGTTETPTETKPASKTKPKGAIKLGKKAAAPEAPADPSKEGATEV